MPTRYEPASSATSAGRGGPRPPHPGRSQRDQPHPGGAHHRLGATLHPELRRMEFTWNFAVCATSSASAMSRLDRPRARSARTSRSRGVKDSAPATGRGSGGGRSEVNPCSVTTRPRLTASSAARRVAPSALRRTAPAAPAAERGAGVRLSLHQREDRRSAGPERWRRRARGVPGHRVHPGAAGSTVTTVPEPASSPASPARTSGSEVTRSTRPSAGVESSGTIARECMSGWARRRNTAGRGCEVQSRPDDSAGGGGA